MTRLLRTLCLSMAIVAAACPIKVFSLGWIHYNLVRSDLDLRGSVKECLDQIGEVYNKSTNTFERSDGEAVAYKYYFTLTGVVQRIDYIGYFAGSVRPVLGSFDVYNYDNSGILTSEASYGPTSSDLYAELPYTRHYQDGWIVLTPGKATGSKVINVLPLIYRIRDDPNRTIRVYNTDGSLRCTITYDQAGYRKSVKEQVLAGFNKYVVEDLTYNRDGQILRDFFPGRYDHTYEYDADGLLVEEHDHDFGYNVNKVLTFEYKLDSHGNWLQKTTFEYFGNERVPLSRDSRVIEYFD